MLLFDEKNLPILHCPRSGLGEWYFSMVYFPTAGAYPVGESDVIPTETMPTSHVLTHPKPNGNALTTLFFKDLRKKLESWGLAFNICVVKTQSY